jgi:hypothetical protein
MKTRVSCLSVSCPGFWGHFQSLAFPFVLVGSVKYGVAKMRTPPLPPTHARTNGHPRACTHRVTVGRGWDCRLPLPEFCVEYVSELRNVLIL